MSEILRRHKAIWEQKKILRAIYHRWYDMIRKDVVNGLAVELGAGTSNLKEALPEVVTSDLQPCEWLDQSFDAHEMPYEPASVSNLIMVDVLHHLAHPIRFFREASRVLKPGGRLLMLEPYPSPFSYQVYKRVHPEPFIWEVDYFNLQETKEKMPFDANQAIPYLLFFRQLEQFEKTFRGQFRIVRKKRLSFLTYPLSGGFDHPSRIPYFLLPVFRLLELLLTPFAWLLAFRCYVVLEKTGCQDHTLINEINHGRQIAEKGEHIWNWSTPAGQVRFDRRVSFFRDNIEHVHGPILEVGCGTGLFTQHISPGKTGYTAIDISEDLLNLARERMEHAQVTFKNENAYSTTFADEQFDRVLGSSVLHHLKVEEALNEFYRLLKPGGWMFFTEPNLLNPQIWMERNIPLLKKLLYISPDETAFIRWKLKKQLKKQGFSQISIVPFDFLHPAIPNYLLPAFKPFTSALEHIPVIKEISGSLMILAKKPAR